MSAGSQSGKTSWGPWWLWREIYKQRGAGDYIAVTATFDLFKLKMLPALLSVFEHIMGCGRYYAGDRIIELKDPNTGLFLAKRSTDQMWGRIILRSADSLGGLESATASGAWLDECGQERFEFSAYKAVRRRVALKRGRILMTTTLYDLGWMSSIIIDPALADGKTDYYEMNGGSIDYTVSKGQNASIIQFDSIVNPAFSKEEFEEQRLLMPEDEFNMFYRGRKSSRRFLIYDAFDPVTHTCPPFLIPQDWKRYIGLDFGPVHTSAVFYAENPQNHILYAYREYMDGHKPISEHARDIMHGEPANVYCVGGSHSEEQWRMEFGKAGLSVLPPLIKDVNLGINRVYAQHKLGGIVYFNTLHGIIGEKSRYRRKRDDLGNALDDIEEKATFHRLDAERYIISVIRPGSPRKAKVLALGDILDV